MKEIKLTQNKVAIVDDEDYEYLNQFKWYFNHGYATRRKTIIVGVKEYVPVSMRYITNPSLFAKKEYKTIQMHNEVLSLHGIIIPKGMKGEHKNCSGLDNRINNLRIATRSQNAMNRDMPRNNTSGYKGVQWIKKSNKWTAIIGYKRKSIYIGTFDNIEDAIKARKEKEKELFGEFAYQE